MIETLADVLVGRRAVSNRPALLLGEQVYTYAELESRSNRVANALIAHNTQFDDFVCQAVGSRPELIINLFGILKSGVRYAPLNPSLTERELSEQLSDCRPAVLIAEDEVAEKLRGAQASRPWLRAWRVEEWAAECQTMPVARNRPPRSGAAVLYLRNFGTLEKCGARTRANPHQCAPCAWAHESEFRGSTSGGDAGLPCQWVLQPRCSTDSKS